MDFQIISDKVLHQTIIPGLVSYCPSMDLIALATKDQGVYIFRLNGERVCGISQQSKHRVERIQWKQDGIILSRDQDGRTHRIQANFLLLLGVILLYNL